MRIRPMAVAILLLIAGVFVADRVGVTQVTPEADQVKHMLIQEVKVAQAELDNHIDELVIEADILSAQPVPSANPEALKPVDGSAPSWVLTFTQVRKYLYVTHGQEDHRVVVENDFYGTTIGVRNRDFSQMKDCPANTLIRYADIPLNQIMGDVEYTVIQGFDWDTLLDAWEWVCNRDPFLPSNVNNTFIGG